MLSTEPVITSPAEPVRPASVDGAISLRDATFCYPGADRPVLQDVSLTARPGTTTAIVGSTGSGKSTLVSLICRMYDVTSGSVRVDDIDVRDYDTEQLWSAIGLVPQRGYLFSGTVADNLRYGKADATDDEMWEALRVASADGFVRAHADGLDMPVAQGGINFSGGQRQRLAIARAVIRRPAIYLFDDAFSALDVHTDARVRSALSEVSADATVVIVAQRISTVAAADQIVVDRRRQGGRAPERTSRCWPTAPPTPSSPIRRRSEPASEAVRDPAAGTPDPRHGAGADGTLPRLQGLRDPAGEAVDPAARPDRGGDPARRRRHRDRRDRSAHPRARHRPVVQRRDRPRTARGSHQGTGRSRPRGPAATTRSPTCCRA